MSQAVRLIFNAALAAADPGLAVSRNLAVENGRLLSAGHAYRLDEFARLLVVGGGKAVASMGLAVEAILGDRISDGLLASNRGATVTPGRLVLVQASHPLPDKAGMHIALRMLDLLHSADERTLVLCLLSGGASALLAAPAAGLLLSDKQEVTDMLLQAGAAIDELNAVRKHLSAIKGGRLARAAFPAPILTLILSDVIGDRIDVIASGPTAPDPTTFADAAAVIAKYELWERLPLRVAAFLRRGLAGGETETVKPHDPCFAGAAYVVVGSLSLALDAAAAKARALGFGVEVVTRELQGEARTAGSFLAEKAMRAKAEISPAEKLCLLSGGETTVHVHGSGKGGRNQELALAFAIEIAGTSGIEMLAAGSDGLDGPTDAAGALVDGGTVQAGARAGLDARTFLKNNDSYSFFQRLDAGGGMHSHIKTGPTGTNVMDVQVILIGPATAAPGGDEEK